MISAEDRQNYQKATKEDLDEYLLIACSSGNFEAVRYLLTSKEIDINAPQGPKHANIHTQDDLALTRAALNGHLEVVKYLFTSNELKEHADIHANSDCAFRWATKKGKLDIINYLIFDCQIEKTTAINHFLHITENDEFTIQVIEMFNARELKKDLDDNLIKKNNKRSVKI